MRNSVRNSNIEGLRIVAMIMIFMHHYIFYGVQEHYDPSIMNVVFYSGSEINKVISKLLLPGGVVGVSIFFLIMGYFGIQNNKVKIFKTIFDVFVYSFLFTILYFVMVKFNLTDNSNLKGKSIKSLFSIASETYWFASVYVIIMLMKESINKYIKKMNQQSFIMFMVVFTFYYAVLRIPAVHYLGLINGLQFYFIGAYIKINEIKISNNKMLWLLIGIIGWIGYYITSCSGLSGELAEVVSLLGICLFGLMSAVGFFIYAIELKEKSNKYVNIIAKTTFAVYLIHENPLYREILWKKLLKVSTFQYPSRYFLFFMIATVIGFFSVVFVIDNLKSIIIDKKVVGFIKKLDS